MKIWFVIVTLPVFAVGFIYEWVRTSFLVGRNVFDLFWELEE